MESLICNTQTGSAAELQDYYDYWRQRILVNLLESLRQQFEDLSHILEQGPSLFTIKVKSLSSFSGRSRRCGAIFFYMRPPLGKVLNRQVKSAQLERSPKRILMDRYGFFSDRKVYLSETGVVVVDPDLELIRCSVDEVVRHWIGQSCRLPQWLQVRPFAELNCSLKVKLKKN